MLKDFSKPRKGLLVAICILGGIILFYVIVIMRYNYQHRHIKLIQKELEKHYDKEDYWVDGCSLETGENQIDTIFIDVSLEAQKREDFLESCYEIKNIIQEIATKNADLFTLTNDKLFTVAFMKKPNDMSADFSVIYFRNNTTDYGDVKYYKELCDMAIGEHVMTISSISGLKDIRFLDLLGRKVFTDDERYWNEIENMLKLPNLESVSVAGFTDDEKGEWKEKFREKGIELEFRD